MALGIKRYMLDHVVTAKYLSFPRGYSAYAKMILQDWTYISYIEKYKECKYNP